MSENLAVITKAIFFEASYEARGETLILPRPFSSLTLREQGKISITSEGKTFYSEPGTLTFVPKGHAYTTRAFTPGKMQILHFYTEGDAPFFSPFSEKPGILLPLQQMFAEGRTHSGTAGCDFLTLSLAYRLLYEMNRLTLRKEPSPPLQMVRCRIYLEENLGDPSLRIGDLAAMAKVSEVYFRREFQKYYGVSPMTYLKNRRMELAKQLLSTSLYSVAEVATRSGFDSLGYFSSEFRRLTGTTPTEYRKNCEG